MTNPAAGGLHLRAFQAEDPPLLRAVFESAVHTVASRHYTPEQCAAWAPHDHDAAAWAERAGRQPLFFTQIGVHHPDAERIATAAGLPYVADRCLMVDYRAFVG